MGGKSSKPAPPPPMPKPKPVAVPVPAPAPLAKAAALPPVIDTQAMCMAKKNELSTLKRDSELRQSEVDACDPASAKARNIAKVTAEHAAYASKSNELMNLDLYEFNTMRDQASVLQNSFEPVQEYIGTVASEVTTLSTEQKELTQEERTRRRAFLDADPQDGVSRILGLAVSDDKVLLTFWICFGLALGIITAIVLKMYEAQIGGTRQKLQIAAVVLGISYGIAYYCITKFA
jgi:hypothetical protein